MSVIFEKDGVGVIHIESPTFGTYDFLIDKEDIEKCSKYGWCVHRVRRKNRIDYYYCMSTKSKDNPKPIFLHRLVTDCPRELYVDHIDRNTFDNRKTNLRFCTQSENSRHRKNHRNNKSGHKGVFLVDYGGGRKRWRAYTKVNYKYVNLGEFVDINDAVKARKEAELKYFGEFQPVDVY